MYKFVSKLNHLLQTIVITSTTMGMEIERKFLVRSDRFKEEAAQAAGCNGDAGVYYRQGYVPTLNGTTVRIRIAGDKGFITIKDRAVGFSRHEFEYSIPREEAEQMLELMCTKPQIEKHRYKIPYRPSTLNEDAPQDETTAHLCWEVDVFHGENEGLIVAELEVPSEDTPISLPDWIGAEVTGDKRYYNSHLIGNPYCKWGTGI